MIKPITTWFKRYFTNPEAVTLFLTLLIAVVVMGSMGHLLAPVIASVIIAYILDVSVRRLEGWKCPHLVSVVIVYLVFVGLFVVALLWLFPLLWRQFAHLFQQVPTIVSHSQSYLLALQTRYPDFISAAEFKQIISTFKEQLASFSQTAVAYSLHSVASALTLVVYLVLVPLLVFFFLKDADVILAWISQFLPKKHRALKTIWAEVNVQTGRYIRGRILEMLVVGVVTAIAFGFLGLEYAVLFGSLVGISVIVPYIGVIVVSVPIIIVSLTQWGLTAHFAYLMAVYAIIVALDANVLVPMLFAETMNLHPVVIILSVLIFGGLWGFWGVFFAIPLATVVNAILKAWPQHA